MRTKKVTRNFIVSTICTVLIALIGIVKSKVFLTYLGDETTGVYQLYSQLYSYLSLVDAGLTGSLLFSLYKPLSEKNYSKINGILKAGRKFFAKIALIIFLLGIILSFNLNFFVNCKELSMNYIQISFILFILASIINYFVTARTMLFEAEQDVYIVHLVTYASMFVKAILEIILAINGFGLFTLMLVALGTSLLQNLILTLISKKRHKYLTFEGKEDGSFKKETKNVLVRRLCGLVFDNTDVIFISKIIGTEFIVIYNAYYYVINSLLNIFKKIGSAALASIGNLLVSEKEKARDFFLEYNSLCFFLGNVIAVPLFFAITPFVELYFGTKYSLGMIGALIMSLLFYIRIINIPLDSFMHSLGYFKEIKRVSVVEAIMNIVLSLLLINKLGIIGAVLATIISYLLCEFIYCPYVINKNYFNKDKINYFAHCLKLMIGMALGCGISYIVMSYITVNNLLIWFVTGLLLFIINLIVNLIYFKLSNELRFVERFKYNFLRKK